MAGESFTEEAMVVFTIARQSYAFPIEAVREVVPLVEPTPMPQWPDYALGVMEIRGELMPLYDPSELLGHRPVPLHAGQRVVVVHLGAAPAGLLVESVEGVVSAAVRPTQALTGHLGNQRLARGLLTHAQGSSVVVDASALLDALRLPPEVR